MMTTMSSMSVKPRMLREVFAEAAVRPVCIVCLPRRVTRE
jgi:hypothetical protein